MNEATNSPTEVMGDEVRAPADDFGAHVRASERRHKRLAFLLTGDLHEAEDLLQAAYAKTYPHWSRVRTYDVPDAYLRRVMVSLRCDSARPSSCATGATSPRPTPPPVDSPGVAPRQEIIEWVPGSDATPGNWQTLLGADGFISYRLTDPKAVIQLPTPVEVRGWSLAGNTLTQSAESEEQCVTLQLTFVLGPC